MARWRPDPTFYASPTLAAEAPAETLAYVAMIAPQGNGKRDAIGVVDTDPGSPTFGKLIGQTKLPTSGNELHHFGWNACSSHLCPWAPHPHVERRYLVVPGHRIVADSHPRHEGRPAEPGAREAHRGARSLGQDGVLRAALGPLRAGRRVHQRVRWR
jgi:hypothetical protein